MCSTVRTIGAFEAEIKDPKKCQVQIRSKQN